MSWHYQSGLGKIDYIEFSGLYGLKNSDLQDAPAGFTPAHSKSVSGVDGCIVGRFTIHTDIACAGSQQGGTLRAAATVYVHLTSAIAAWLSAHILRYTRLMGNVTAGPDVLKSDMPVQSHTAEDFWWCMDGDQNGYTEETTDVHGFIGYYNQKGYTILPCVANAVSALKINGTNVMDVPEDVIASYSHALQYDFWAMVAKAFRMYGKPAYVGDISRTTQIYKDGGITINPQVGSGLARETDLSTALWTMNVKALLLNGETLTHSIDPIAFLLKYFDLLTRPQAAAAGYVTEGLCAWNTRMTLNGAMPSDRVVMTGTDSTVVSVDVSSTVDDGTLTGFFNCAQVVFQTWGAHQCTPIPYAKFAAGSDDFAYQLATLYGAEGDVVNAFWLGIKRLGVYNPPRFVVGSVAEVDFTEVNQRLDTIGGVVSRTESTVTAARDAAMDASSKAGEAKQTSSETEESLLSGVASSLAVFDALLKKHYTQQRVSEIQAIVNEAFAKGAAKMDEVRALINEKIHILKKEEVENVD